MVAAIEYDFNTVDQTKYYNNYGGTGSSSYMTIGLEKVWVAGIINDTFVPSDADPGDPNYDPTNPNPTNPSTAANIMYYDYGIQPSGYVTLSVENRGKWRTPYDINRVIGVGKPVVSNPNSPVVYSLCNDTVNNRMYIGGQFQSLMADNGTGGIVGKYKAVFIAYYDKCNNVFISAGTSQNPAVTFPDPYGSRVTSQKDALYNACFIGPDGSTLQSPDPISPSTYGGVRCLYYNAAKNQLYVGGCFIITKVIGGGQEISLVNIAIWDFNINDWITLDGGYHYLGLGSLLNLSLEVRAFAFDQNSQRLYIGGTFTDLLKVDGATDKYKSLCYFDFINNSYNHITEYYIDKGEVNALAYDHTSERLYMGGKFTDQIQRNGVNILEYQNIKWVD